MKMVAGVSASVLYCPGFSGNIHTYETFFGEATICQFTPTTDIFNDFRPSVQ
jgi:hypothetical protein